MNDTMMNFYNSHITIQLLDGASQKILHEERGHNFAANQVIRHAKWQQRNLYKTGLTSLGSTDTDYQPHSATDALVLTDSALTEDSVNEWSMPGKLVGYSTKATYAGTDTLRGTPNVSQLETNASYTKWVFDWPTNAGNGTINSVGWCYKVFNGLTGDNAVGSSFFTGCTIEQTWSTPQNWRYFARANANLSFGNLANTVIYVLNSTFQQTTTFNVSGQFTAVRGIAWDSGNSFLWVIGDNGAARRIAAYNSAGVLQTGPYTITTRGYAALAHDGTKLWTASQINNQNYTMWSISTSDGSDVSNFNFDQYYSTLTGQYNRVAGLCWDSNLQRLWLRTCYGTNTSTYGEQYVSCLTAFDTSGNKVMVDVSLAAWTPSSANLTYLRDANAYNDIDIIDSSQFLIPFGSMYRVRIDGMGTRYKLDSPVVKSNSQTLKVIYQINYV